MTRYTDNRKKERTLKFLNSLINVRIRSLMASRGFDEVELVKGWNLLESAAGKDLRIDLGRSPLDGKAKKLLTEADAWENTWYPVADATLDFEYPEIHERVFLNLAKTSGPELLVNLKTFLRRLDELEQSGDLDDQAALELLAKRGLDRDQRGVAQALLDQALQLDFDVEPEVNEAERQARADAVTKMWAWTKSWAVIARTVVQDKRLRIHMGISQMGSAGEADLDFDLDGDLDDEPEAPVVVSPPSPAEPVAPVPRAPTPEPTPSPEPTV